MYPIDKREQFTLPLFKIVAREYAEVGPAGAVLLCPIQGDTGPTAMIFTTRDLGLAALAAMPKMPYTCEVEEIATVAHFRELLAGFKAAGDTHFVIDPVFKPWPPSVLGKFGDIERFDKIAAFVEEVQDPPSRRAT